MRAQAIAILLLTALAAPGAAFAGLFFHRPQGTPPPGKPRQIPHTMERAGNPHWISPCAQPTITPEYVGYYVGGGTAYGGGPRTWEQGTWGWDYEGAHFLRRVPLGWSQGRRYQGGGGTYPADHPKLPDIFVVPRLAGSEGR